MKPLKRFRFLLILLVAVCALCAVFSAFAFRGGSGNVTDALHAAFSPARGFFSSAGKQIGKIGVWLRDKEEMQEQIVNLEKELAQKEQELTALREKSENNDFLTEVLELKKEHTDYQFVYANVLAANMNNTSSELILNKGENWGIRKGMPVLSAEGLVGVVRTVSQESCTVAPVGDKSVQLGVYLEPGGGLGLLQGELELWEKGQVAVTGLPRETAVEPGDTVRTSGSSGLYPRGLAVGTVREIQTDHSNGNLYLLVEPLCQTEQLDEVMILTSFSTQIES